MEIKIKICFRIIVISLIISLLMIIPYAESKTMLIGFKKGEKKDSLPDGWEDITYLRTRKNRISVSKDGKYTVLKVKSIGSASALLRKLNIELDEFPILVWRWKINRVPGMAIETRKDRNDSAARIRVIFNKKEKRPSYKSPEISKLFEKLGFHLGTFEPRGFKIDYIWGNTAPKGKVINYPDSGNHKVVIVESGNKRAKRWIWEKRDLNKDFRKFFGAPALNLTGIVVLTDTDQTNNGVTAWYSSIVLMSK